ncbi:hypothetical protein R3P38DRAFT_313907 [Favolaschia claudopus]|uniref:Secreted protein n=1 Tax=Favolaschia claudopus TaxID=2862362 RepID=A0AAW0CQN8_9AGAR
MFFKVTPIAVVLAASTLTTAAPWWGWGGRPVTITRTVTQCPASSGLPSASAPSLSLPSISASVSVPSVSASSPAMSMPSASGAGQRLLASRSGVAVPAASASGGVSVNGADVTDLVNGLNGVGPLVNRAKNTVPTLLATLGLNGLTGQGNQLQNRLNGFSSQLNGVTGQVGTINNIINRIGNGTPPSDASSQITTAAQTAVRQLTNLADQLNDLISAIKKSPSSPNTSRLQTALLHMLNQVQALVPGLTNQVTSSSQQSLITDIQNLATIIKNANAQL